MMRVDSERLRPRRLWQSFDQLLECGQALAATDIDTSTLHHFLDDKVAGVCDATAGASGHSEVRFFRPVMPTDIIKLVCRL